MNFSKFHERFTSRYNKKLKEVCVPFFQMFGLTSFYYNSSNGSCFSTICTDIDLQNYYFDNKKLYKNNPYIMLPSQLNSGLYIDTSVENDKFQRAEHLLEEKFDTKYVWRVIKTPANSCQGARNARGRHVQQFGFGRHPDNIKVDSVLINQMPLIERFIKYFQNEMDDVLREMDQNAIDLQADMDAADAMKTGVPDLGLAQCTKSSFLQKMGCPPHLVKIRFSKRELDVLHHYVKGYPAKKIAEHLWLSHRTIENYIVYIKDKLFASDKSELLDTLHMMQEYNLYPEIFHPPFTTPEKKTASR